MTDITTFPGIQNVLYSGDNVIEMIVDSSVTRGNVVGINTTSKSVRAVSTGEEGIGVALTTQTTATGKILIALPGCICYVANSTDSKEIDAGAYCGAGTLDGTVTELTIDTTSVQQMVGIAIDDIAVSSYGLMLIAPAPV